MSCQDDTPSRLGGPVPGDLHLVTKAQVLGDANKPAPRDQALLPFLAHTCTQAYQGQEVQVRLRAAQHLFPIPCALIH